MANVVTVVGSGYVGTTTAALLAASGVRTYAVDIDSKKIDKLNNGQAPFFEAGLDALVAHGISTEKLTATESYQESVTNSNIVMSSVGTPDNPDGSPNLEYVFTALESIAKVATGPIIYVQKSTVPVGTGKQIIKRFAELSSVDFTYISSPEFLREGTAVVDSIEPDRIVVGGEEAAGTVVSQLFLDIYEQRQDIGRIAGQKLLNRSLPKIHKLNIESAELTKVSANAFLALKISFANSIAKLADATNADITEVMDAVGADQRIGRAFLNAGRGYGGGCFPKDVRGLISSADTFGADLSIMRAASELNQSMPSYIVEMITKDCGELKGKKVGLLGLAFKAGTSDVRKSPGIIIANLLAEMGAEISAYDPEARQEATPELADNIMIKDTVEAVIKDCDIVVVTTDWPEFKQIDFSKYDASYLFDGVNMFEPEAIRQTGLHYRGVGRR
jgi:UDPglucose 6-dehydrogenase